MSLKNISIFRRFITEFVSVSSVKNSKCNDVAALGGDEFSRQQELNEKPFSFPPQLSAVQQSRCNNESLCWWGKRPKKFVRLLNTYSKFKTATTIVISLDSNNDIKCCKKNRIESSNRKMKKKIWVLPSNCKYCACSCIQRATP